MKIEAKVNQNGEIEIETIGFDGQSCLNERDKLAKVLRGAGIELNVNEGKIRLKSANEILAEKQEMGREKEKQ